MGKPLAFIIFFLCAYAEAQVIPDLTTGDHFLPNLSENKKQEIIIKSFQEKTNGKVAQTSQELYPHLYRYTNNDPLAPLRATSADPANAIKDHSSVEHIKVAGKSYSANPSVSSALYNSQLSIHLVDSGRLIH